MKHLKKQIHEIVLWKSKNETLIQAEKLYQNPELTPNDLAKN
jgi:hypothetical protein